MNGNPRHARQGVLICGAVRAARQAGRRAAVPASTLLLGVAALVALAIVAYVRVARFTPAPGNSAPVTTAAPIATYFREVAKARGIDFVHDCGAEGDYYIPEEMGSGAAWIDYDGDGRLDLYLVQGGKVTGEDPGHRNRLYRNREDGRFEDVSQGSGADVTGYGMGAYAVDYDNDGRMDLYVTCLGPNILLHNNGDGTFSDVTEQAGVGDPGFSTGAAFFDADHDGYLDVYVTNYLEWSPSIELPTYGPTGVRDYRNPVDYNAPAKDRFYHNRGDGTFEDRTDAAGMARALGQGLGVMARDFSGDGRLDLYIANDQSPAFLWVNQGDGTFEDRAAFAGCAFNRDGLAIAGMGVVSEDLDGDLDFDLVVTNIHDQAHLALRNDAGLFEDVTTRWGFDGWGVPYTGFGIVLFDRDLDGTLEGIVGNGAVNIQLETHRPGHPYAEPNQYIVRREGRFADDSLAAGFPFREIEMSRGVAAADFDNDGDVDVLIVNNRGPAELLENTLESPSAWTVLDILPDTGNRVAFNAVVTLQAGGKVHYRAVCPHAGYLSSQDPRLHFGLGDADKIDKVTVAFQPSDGSANPVEETWTDLPVRTGLQLRQGASPEFTRLSTP